MLGKNALGTQLKLLAQKVNKQRWLLILILLLLGVVILKLNKGKKDESQLLTLQGYAMGKDYKIYYQAGQGANYQEEVDSLLAAVEQVLAMDQPDSELSQFNAYDCQAFHFKTPHLYPVLAKSKEVYNHTAGAFDPTVAPLVNAWKGRPNQAFQPSNIPINALHGYVSLDYIVVNEKRVKRLKEGVKLDLNGLAPGYGADVVASFLKQKGINDLLVTLGDEVVAYGKLAQGKPWQVSVAIPTEAQAAQPLQITTKLTNQATSTTRRYRHAQLEPEHGLIINPQTGCPAQNDLLSVTVFAHDGITADAYATAMMAQGLSFAQELVERLPSIEAFLVYQDEQGKVAFYASQGLKVIQSAGGQEVQLSSV